MDRTLLLLKPDGVNLGLMDEITELMEQEGLILRDFAHINMKEETVRALYNKYTEAWFFDQLLNYLSEDVSILSVWEGPNAVEVANEIKGSSYQKTGLRGRWSSCELENTEGEKILLRNVLHVSDPENFETEYALLQSLIINNESTQQ